MKRLIGIGIFALALTAVGANAAEVIVRYGPPRPVREVIVARPGPRHVWISGHHAWNGNRYTWEKGYWALPPRPHAVWVPGQWVPRRGGHVWIAGYWR